MKKIFLFLFVLWAFAFQAFSQCSPPLTMSVNESWNRVQLTWTTDAFDIDTSLYYGNSLSTGIGIGDDPASYMMGIRFTPTELANVDGMYLTSVSYYAYQAIDAVLKIFTGGSITNGTVYDPGTLVDSVFIPSSSLTSGQLNTVPLSNPVTINSNDEIWIILCYENQSGYPLGATANPNGTANINKGDLLYLGGWQSMIRDQQNNLDYVFYMHANLQENVPSITGYNVLRDNVAINSSPFMGFSYIDSDVTPQESHCYTVEAVCTSGSAAYQPEVCVTIPDQPSCITIGNTTTSQYILPLNTFYNYSYTQQIFSPSELSSQGGVIEGIGFQYIYGTPQTKTNQRIFMANVSDSVFATSASWIPASALTEVFNGTITFSNANTYTQIQFDEPFEWDGVSSVVIAYWNGSGTYTTSDNNTFNVHNAPGNRSLYVYQDGSAYNIESPPSGTLSPNRNNVEFCFGPAPTCYKPVRFTVQNVQHDAAELTWCRHDVENEWEVVVVESGNHVNTGTPESVYDTVYTIQNLNSNTSYDVYVRAVCGSGDESDWVMRSFTTTCVPVDVLPLTEDFEGLPNGGSPNCFIRSGTQTAYPCVSTTYHASGTNSYYFYNTYSNYSCVALQAIDESIDLADLRVSFSLLKTSASYKLDVGVMTDPTDPTTFQLVQNVSPAENSQWESFQIFLNNYTGNGHYIAFRSDLTGISSSNYMYLDDIVVDYAPQCSEPVNLSISQITGTSAVVEWSVIGAGVPASFTVEVSEAEMENWVSYYTTNTYFMIPGLNPSTMYDVRVSTTCEDGSDSQYSSVEHFITRCLSGGEFTIGTGTETTTYLPFQGCYNYAYSQQLFSSSEMGSPTTIRGIAFHKSTNTTSSNDNKNIDIYLGNTNISALSTSTYVPYDSLTLVFSGNVNFALGWTEITFDTPYQYDGRNLVIAVDNNTGSYNCTPYFTSTSGHTSIYQYGDGTNYNPASPSTFTQISYRNNVKFFADCDSTASCVAPSVLITSVTSTEINIEWAPGYSETEWELDYKLENESSWTSSGALLTGNSYTLTNLVPSSTYNIRMRSDCGSGEYSDYTLLIVNTPCSEIETLPYYEGFDSTSTIPSCWYTGTNATTSYPYISTTYAESNPRSVYFYGGSYYCYLAAPAVDATLYPANTLMVSFDLLKTSSSYFLEVGIMSNPEDYSTFQLIATCTPSNINTWENFEVSFNTYFGTTGNIAFRVPMGTSNYMYLDNVNIDQMAPCARPNDLTFSNIHQDEATISWTPADDTYDFMVTVEYNDANMNLSSEVLYTTDTFLTIQNLLSNTEYRVYVQTICSDGVSVSTQRMGRFTTLCSAITDLDLPYIENFDTYGTGTGAFPNCWGRPIMYSNAPYIYASNYTSAPGSLFFRSLTSTPTTAVSPQLDVDIQTLQVTFQLKAENPTYSGSFEVGVMSDPSNPSTFESVSTILPTNSDFAEYEVLFNTTTLQGTGNFIAFRQHSNTDNYYYWLDDVIISTISECPRPSSITIAGTTQNSVSLAWTPTGTETEWEIIYGPTGFNPATGGTTYATTNNPETITNLSSSITYDFYVQAVCGSGEVSTPRGPVSATPGSVNMPTSGTITVNMCSGHIFDDGGANGDYSSYCDGIIIVNPETPGNVVSISGTYIGEGGYDYLKIYDGVGTSGTQLCNISSPSSGTPVTVGPFTSTTGSLTVQFTSDVSGEYDGFDLIVSCESAACLRPSNITGVSDLNSIELSWNESGTATSWNIYYGEAGFNPETGGTMVTVTTNPYTITGLSSTTLYDFYVQSNCDDGETSNYSNVASIGTSICSAADQCNFTLNMNDGFGDGWNDNFLVIKQNGIMVGTYTIEYGSTSTETITLCDGIAATMEWIEGDYADETSFTITDANGTVVATYAEGSLGMSGQIGTFNVNCSGGTTPTECNMPTNLATSNISQTGVTATWSAGGTENAWNVQYKQASAANWGNSISVNTTNYNITGLTANTAYQVRVQAVCDASTTSDWTAPVSFTTLQQGVETCPSPTNLTATDVQNESITLTWNQEANTANNWTVNYRTQGATAWNSATATAVPYTLTGLTGLTTYEIQVIANCTNGLTSDPSSTITATTTNVGVNEHDLDRSVSVYPNPTAGQITITAKSAMESVCIYDVYGKLISTQKVEDTNAVVEMSGYAAGVYFAKITTAEGIVTKRIVKR